MPKKIDEIHENIMTSYISDSRNNGEFKEISTWIKHKN